MIEAFANHLGSHIGRHLFYWATTTAPTDHNSLDTETDYGLKLRISNLINKFHGPLERGVQILDHLLTLEEEDFNDHWGSAYIHNYEPEILGRREEQYNTGGRVDGNQEVLYYNGNNNNNGGVIHRQNIARGNSEIKLKNSTSENVIFGCAESHIPTIKPNAVKGMFAYIWNWA
ncbi:hypothetical protein CVS40_0701 [Lucilia cuprina]|nr:hypothetical protein CVS40_0701 [Lucilia cuprina]